ncbi:MAG: potassium channel family protein [Verrucomicrobiota bacterium]
MSLRSPRQLPSVPMLLAVALVLATAPFRFLTEDSWLSVLVFFCWSLAISVSALCLSAGLIWYRIFGVLCFGALCAMIGDLVDPSDSGMWKVLLAVFGIGVELMALILLIWHAFRPAHKITSSYFRADLPALGFDRIIAALVGYFMIAILWESFYSLIIIFQPATLIDQVSGAPVEGRHLLYYSLITQTTQGYGDIVPRGTLARYVAAFQGAFGTIYLAVLVAVLIGILQQERSREDDL